MNWGFKTTPQKQCLNREMDYSRGLGLGGSSAINFGVYTIGARDEYDEWARLVTDDSFAWKAMQRRFKSLEAFDARLPAGVSAKYAAPDPLSHGDAGTLKVGYAPEWERDLEPMLDIIKEAGLPTNPDHNSGNPIGMSVLINSAQSGLRSTAKDLITPYPRNLTVRTNARVQRLYLDGKKVVGVVCSDTTCALSLKIGQVY
jgi:choline dehydrogenase-like flavoprotein